MSVISPVSDDLAVVFLPLLPAGLPRLARRAGDRAGRGPRGGVRDARLQRPRGPAGGRDRGRGQSRHAARPRGGRGRGPRDPARRGRRERLGRGDVPDPADPAGMSGPIAALETAAAAVDPVALRVELQAIVRIPSITGQEQAVAAELAERLGAAGMAVETSFPDPAAIRADPAWPGEETERSVLPVIIGRMGRPGGRRVILSGHVDVVPPGDPATWSTDPWGGEVRDGRLFGRGACDMKGGVAAILGAVRALAASAGGRPARRRAPRRARAGRGGRRPGHARRDPGRGNRRSRDHHRAVEPRDRRRPRRGDHVPPDGARAGGPRQPAPRGRLGARQPVRRPARAGGRRDRAGTRRRRTR